MSEDSLLSKFEFLRSLPNLIVFSLFVVGALVLVWVGSLTMNDISVWNKDLGNIFFGSRTGENISLGIGMTLINYVYISIAFFGAGTVMLVRNRMVANAEPEQMVQTVPKRTITKNKSKTGRLSRKSATKEKKASSGEDRFFSGCLHTFGYLSSRPKDEPVPPECIVCQRLGDCMLATVYVTRAQD